VCHHPVNTPFPQGNGVYVGTLMGAASCLASLSPSQTLQLPTTIYIPYFQINFLAIHPHDKSRGLSRQGFVNSPYTGNFEDYIVKDVIDYVDANYRTIPDRQHRAIIGGSMGGYGALSICLHHPEKFIAAVALSPANITIDLLDWKLITPIYEKLLGREIAEQLGASSYSDILDTFDIIFSRDNPLMPSIKRDKNGKIVEWDKKAANNWQKYDINHMIRKNPNALKKVKLLINCEDTDEYGLTGEARKIHETLEELGIKHQFEIYSDPKAALSPHILGIAYHILPGIKFCLQQLT